MFVTADVLGTIELLVTLLDSNMFVHVLEVVTGAPKILELVFGLKLKIEFGLETLLSMPLVFGVLSDLDVFDKNEKSLLDLVPKPVKLANALFFSLPSDYK